VSLTFTTPADRRIAAILVATTASGLQLSNERAAFIGVSDQKNDNKPHPADLEKAHYELCAFTLPACLLRKVSVYTSALQPWHDGAEALHIAGAKGPPHEAY
jgi:hypothetical protein